MKLHFGDNELDCASRLLKHAGRDVRLSTKAFDLLALLAERRPAAVPKSDLKDRLWPGTFVSDGTLASLLVEVRSAIGDTARDSRFVRTVHRFGYAFSGDVDELRTRASADGARTPVYRLIWGNREIAVNPGENQLGRDEDSIVWIDDSVVSRRHARIVVDEKGAVLEDLGSRNGTYLRGKKITAPAKLADGDQLRIGPASMVFRVFKQTASTATAVER